jgi:hypothetical protein
MGIISVELLKRTNKTILNMKIELCKQLYIIRARGSVPGWSAMLQAGRLRVRFQIKSLDFFSVPSPSSRTIALGFTQPLTEMSTRTIPGSKVWPARKAHNFTTIYEQIVCKICEPRRLTTLQASTAYYSNSFSCSYLLLYIITILATEKKSPRRDSWVGVVK